MNKSIFKTILSIILTASVLAALAVTCVSASEPETPSDTKSGFPFDDNILLSIFWPPTKDYITDEQYKLIAEAGINWVMGSGEETLCTPENQAKMLALCAKYGIGMTVSDGSFGKSLLYKTDEEIAAAVKRYENVPAAEGFYILDEPQNPNEYINAYVALKKAAPDKYMHLNFLPDNCYPSAEIYKAQMNDWCRLAAASGYPLDYLMFDRYPFPLEEGTMNRKEFFSNVRNCYEVGLNNGVKTGLYIQTVCQEVLFRRPTDSEIRYEMYASLAFGFKQLSFFTWFTPSNRGEPFRDGIISADGKPNAHYETVKTINHEILNIGSTLVKCDALQVYFNGKNTYGQPSVPDNFFVHAKDDDSVILSFLRHKETGRNYLMVVNNDYSDPQDIELVFDSKIKSLHEVSRADGSLIKLKTDGQKLSLTLAAGDGRLIALPEKFDYYKEETTQPAASSNLASGALITAPESQGSGGWYISCLNDGRKKADAEMSGWKALTSGATYLTIDLKSSLKFNRIDLYPSEGMFEKATSFPKNITVSVSDDGVSFTEIKKISNIKFDGARGMQIDVPQTSARYVRLDMKGSNGASYISLNEVEIFNDNGTLPDPDTIFDITTNKVITYKKGANVALKKDVYCSSHTPDLYLQWGWSPEYVNDGKTDTGWTSNVGLNSTPNATEHIIVDFGDLFAIENVTLKTIGLFPEDYRVELSADGINWTTVKNVTGAPDYEDAQSISIKVKEPTPARFVRVTGTKLRGGGVDGYLLQIGEIEAYGDPVCDKTALKKIIDLYLSKGGDKSSLQYKNAVNGLNNELLTQTQANKLVKNLSSLANLLKDKKKNETDPGSFVLPVILTVTVAALIAGATAVVLYKKKKSR